MEKPSLIEKLAVADAAPERLLGVFVKEPVAGRVKTRLTPPLKPEEAARLYEVAMRETLSRFGNAGFQVVLFYAGSLAYFQQNFPKLPRVAQVEGDLGQRMAAAFRALLETGCRAAALVGSDSPDLPVAQVEAAFRVLADHDVVTIPADDGGYVLVGQARFCPEIFADVPWSTAEVSNVTRQRATEHALRYRECGGWVDVDDQDSLLALLARSPESVTASHVRQHLAHYLNPTE